MTNFSNQIFPVKRTRYQYFIFIHMHIRNHSINRTSISGYGSYKIFQGVSILKTTIVSLRHKYPPTSIFLSTLNILLRNQLIQ